MNQYEIDKLNKEVARLSLENEAIVSRIENMKSEIENLIDSKIEELKDWVQEHTLNGNDIESLDEVGTYYSSAIAELQQELKARFPDFRCWELIL